LREKLKLSLTDLETTFEEKRNRLQEVINQKRTEEAKISQIRGMLKIYDYAKFERHTLQELSSSLDRGLKFIENLNKTYEESADRINKNEQKLSRLTGQLSSEEKALEDLLNKTVTLDEEIQQLLRDKNFASVQQVS